MNQVMSDNRLLGHPYQDADRVIVVYAAIVNMIVGNTIILVVILVQRIGPLPGVAVSNRAGRYSSSAQIVEVVAFNYVLGTAVQQAEANTAGVFDGPADKMAAAGVCKADSGVDPVKFPGSLGLFLLNKLETTKQTREALGRQRPVRIGCSNTLEMEISHRLLLRASNGQQRILDQRRNHLGSRQILPFPRPIGKYARLAIQVPFTRRVEELAGVLEITPETSDGKADVIFSGKTVRPHMRRRQGKGVFFFIHASQAFSRRGIVADPNHLDIGEVLPGLDGMIHPQGDDGIMRIAVISSGDQVPPSRPISNSCVWRSCSYRSLSIDKQLVKIPFARLDFGQLNRPDFTFSLFPAGNHPPAAQDHSLTRYRRVCDRILLRAGIFRTEN
ncbi:MAG: hypothetical protein BWY71_02084 [Planctomycetes bacterium ADurb.Bin412]|nr:MAG: hypothetical protein BWY71_02084 [Planctomycetes bacterium ADurb.Bin412]